VSPWNLLILLVVAAVVVAIVGGLQARELRRQREENAYLRGQLDAERSKRSRPDRYRGEGEDRTS
jgi:cell division protein FtsL